MTTILLYAISGACAGIGFAIALPVVSEALWRRRIERLTPKRPKAKVVTLQERIAAARPETEGEAA